MPDDDPKGIADVVLSGGRKSNHLAVPDSDDFEIDDEPSAVKQSDTSDGLLFKIGLMVERQSAAVKKIPEIDDKLTQVCDRQETMGNRLASIERNGHPCQQLDTIGEQQETIGEQQETLEAQQETIDALVETADDVTEEVKASIEARDSVQSLKTEVEEDVGDLKNEIKEFRSGRVKALVAAIMGFLSIIGTVGGTSYCVGTSIGDVRGALATEKVLRDEQHSTVKTRLDKLPTKLDVPTKAQVTEIGEAVSNGDEFESRCKRLSAEEKRHLARQVQQGRLPPTFLCL